jgi:hypothetical protein
MLVIRRSKWGDCQLNSRNGKIVSDEGISGDIQESRSPGHSKTSESSPRLKQILFTGSDFLFNSGSPSWPDL